MRRTVHSFQRVYLIRAHFKGPKTTETNGTVIFWANKRTCLPCLIDPKSKVHRPESFSTDVMTMFHFLCYMSLKTSLRVCHVSLNQDTRSKVCVSLIWWPSSLTSQKRPCMAIWTAPREMISARWVHRYHTVQETHILTYTHKENLWLCHKLYTCTKSVHKFVHTN